MRPPRRWLCKQLIRRGSNGRRRHDIATRTRSEPTYQAIDSGRAVCGARLPTAWWLESSARQRCECGRVRAQSQRATMLKSSARLRHHVASRFSHARLRQQGLRRCRVLLLVFNADVGRARCRRHGQRRRSQQPRYPPRSRLAQVTASSATLVEGNAAFGSVVHSRGSMPTQPPAASSDPLDRCQRSLRPRRPIPWIDANAASGRVVRHHIRCRSRPRRRGVPSVRGARAPRPCPSVE